MPRSMQLPRLALLAALAAGAGGCGAPPVAATGAAPAASAAPQKNVVLEGKLTLKGTGERPVPYLHTDSGELWEVQGAPRSRLLDLQGRRVRVTGEVLRAKGSFVVPALRADGVVLLD
jgi:hypothetical protein